MMSSTWCGEGKSTKNYRQNTRTPHLLSRSEGILQEVAEDADKQKKHLGVDVASK